MKKTGKLGGYIVRLWTRTLVGYIGTPTWQLPSRATVGRDSTKRARRAAKRGIGGKREGGGSRL